MTLVIIPARGGSKGIPRKNLQTVGGVSLIERAVRTAVEAGVGPVLVGTDDEEIREQAERSGAITWKRALVPDDQTTEFVLAQILSSGIAMMEFCNPAHAILMQCTSPFTGVGDVQAVDSLLRAGCDCVVSCTPFHGFVWRRNGNPVDHDPRQPRPPRQSVLEPDGSPGRLLENGALYGFAVGQFLASGTRFGSCIYPATMFVMPPERSLEIDEPLDLKLANMMYLSSLADMAEAAAWI